MLSAVIAWLACLFDAILGDPETKFHPVALMGRLISFFDRLFYNKSDSAYKQFACGLILTILVSCLVYDLVLGIQYLLDSCSWPVLKYLGQALLLAFFISPHSLAKAGHEIQSAIEAGSLSEARRKLGFIVGRDTAYLQEKDISRAAVETVAENIVDGIISPLVFFFLGGLPLAAMYRAANTMDSMLGYKNEKYMYFGRAAARFDDILNYVPARLTGILLVIVSFILGFDYAAAWCIMRRDAVKHPSPNGGWPESAVAGALHIRLGGINSYFGQLHFRAYMGEPLQQITAVYIGQTISLMYGTTCLFLCCSGIGVCIWRYLCSLF